MMVLSAIFPPGVSSHADAGPQPPCGSAAFPPYPGVEESPTVRVWDAAASGRDWTPPACTGWTSPGFTTLVVTAARFRHASGVGDLLRRVGAISERTGILYWSTTKKRWQTLILDACALQGPAGGQRRKDFSPDDMTEGKPLFFLQEDNLFGKAIYRMRIRSLSSDRLVFDTENAGPVRNLLLLFRPGEIQSLHFLERESRDVWRYYGMMRTGRNANPLTAGHDASYVNRAVAFYRFLAGIPTDREPPAAP
jgi:hypothetical protein